MKKDIPILKVEDLILAVAPRMENGTPEADMWDAFIINLKDEPIQNVLINSRGYGEIEGEQMKTTVLRHYFEEIGPRTACKIEPIQTKLFQLTNEYWVSFTYSGYMYDKKYIFVKGSISEENFTHIPLLDRLGVMIK